MSVIAKVIMRSRRDFTTGALIELGCICDNDLMAAYATSEEDKLFTKYSPSGEIWLNTASNYVFGTIPEIGNVAGQPPPASFYVMLITDDEVPVRHSEKHNVSYKDFPGAAAWCQVNVFSKTTFGHDCVRFEFRESRGPGAQAAWRGVERLNWKMSVDNPPASDQLEHGKEFWCVFYDAQHFDRDAAIRSAHGHE